jgi:hypothetical protein
MTIDDRVIVDTEPSAASIQTALDAVLNSDNLAGSTQLQEFLINVVKAGIEGKGNKIPAKVISEDVYEQAISGNSDNDNVVRVDAGMGSFGTFTLSNPTDMNGQQWALNNFVSSASRYASPVIRLRYSMFNDQKAYTVIFGM